MTNWNIAFPRVAGASLQPMDRIAQTDGKHGLASVFQDIDHTARRILQEDMAAIREQVIFGRSAYGFHQPPAKLTLEEPDYPANFLEREAAFAEFADHCNFSEIVHRIDALVTVAGGNHDAALVPPLKLAQADASEPCDVARCK